MPGLRATQRLTLGLVDQSDHHTIVDKNGGSDWSVDASLEMKSEHEQAVDAESTIFGNHVQRSEYTTVDWDSFGSFPSLDDIRAAVQVAAERLDVRPDDLNLYKPQVGTSTD